MLIIGLVNVGLALIPGTFAPFTMLTDWINIGSLFVGLPLIIGSVLLILCAIGLILRLRTAWAVTVTLLVLIAGSEFLFRGTIQVGIASLLLMIWLFAKRDAFDRPFSIQNLEQHFQELKDEWAQRKQRRLGRDGKAKAPTSGASAELREKTGWGEQAKQGVAIASQAEQQTLAEESK